MSAIFEKAWARSSDSEGLGEYSDDPKDRGGETYTGIARKKRPGWKGWPVLDSRKVRPDFPACLKKDAELLALVKQDYYESYWLRLGLDKMPESIALEVFDTALNQGTGASVQHLQRCLNFFNRNGELYHDVTVDGDLGPATFAALDAFLKARGARGERILWKFINSLQAARYIAIAEKDPTQEVFAYGWAGRVMEEEDKSC